MDEGKIPIKTVDNSNKAEEVTKLEAIIGWFDSMRVLDGFDNLKSAYRSFGFQISPEALIKFRNEVDQKLTLDKSYKTKYKIEQVNEGNKQRILEEIDEFIKKMNPTNK